MNKAKCAAVLCAFMLSVSSPVTGTILATQKDFIDEEFETSMVDAYRQGNYPDTSGVADTVRPASGKDLCRRLSELTFTVEWEEEKVNDDDIRETVQHSFEWSPKLEDIREQDEENAGFFIRPNEFVKKFYIHTQEPDRQIRADGGNKEVIHIDNLQNKSKFQDYGWEGHVAEINLICPAGEDSSNLENWKPETSILHSQYYQYGAASGGPFLTLTFEEAEELLLTVNLNLQYPDGDTRQEQFISLPYIPGTLVEIKNLDRQYYPQDDTTQAILNLKPYFEQIRDEKEIRLVPYELCNYQNNVTDWQTTLSFQYENSGNGSASDYHLCEVSLDMIPVTEEDVMPEQPETLGHFVLIDETTGNSLAEGVIPAAAATLDYRLTVWDEADSQGKTVNGTAALDPEKMYEEVRKQTGYTVESDYKLLDYNFHYQPTVKNETQNWSPCFKSGETVYLYTKPDHYEAPAAQTEQMYRLYNPNSGEHFYTANEAEKNHLVSIGWDDEGIGWTGPKQSSIPVYRVYNPNAGDHHYTMNAAEKNHLVSIGWKDEGIGWYSDEKQSVPLYRQYNPNAKAGAHNYTASTGERDYLVSSGWNDEGIAWYGIK